MIPSDGTVEMLRIGFDSEEDRANYFKNRIPINKQKSRILARARKRAKQETCYICNQSCSSFCNSHSVPQFCLKRIAVDGKVYASGIQYAYPILGDDSGVKEAGTFHLICRECDSKLFQEYEDPSAYSSRPTGKMMAQIVMKNYLLMISKRLNERAIYQIVSEDFENGYKFAKHQLEIVNVDLAAYQSAFKRAKLAVAGDHSSWYYLCYYKQLDYVVPYAFQGSVAMVSDFDDNVINDIYNLSPTYRAEEIHIAVFPLEKTSVVMLIIDSRDKRYRKFYQALNKLPLDEQLAAINYIIFSYSENVFISKNISTDVLDNEYFLDACQKCSTAILKYPLGNKLNAAVRNFSLSKRNEVPNLLNRQYALSIKTTNI